MPDGTYITKQMLEQYGKTKVLFKGMKMAYILWNTNSGIKERTIWSRRSISII